MMHKNSEKGQAIILLVLLITGLLAVSGLAIDGGRVYSARRSAQNAADNAALAAALAICNGTNVTTAGLAAAAQNEFNNDGTTNSVVVTRPPSTGPNAGDNDYVQVVINSSTPATLTRLVFQGNLAYSARAVAHCQSNSTPPGNGYAMIVLRTQGGSSYSSPYDRYPLKSKPGGLIRVTGTIFVNSASPDAYSSYGHSCGSPANYGVQATAGVVVGGPYQDCAGYLNPSPTTGASSMADPLESLAGMPNPAGSCVTYSLSSGSATINPGEYCSITVSNSAQLTMNAGHYYISGNVIVRNSARLTANGVMFYSPSGDITLEDNSITVMSAPTSGDYRGMAIFLDDGDQLEVLENASLTVNGGTIYAPNAFLEVYGVSAGYRAIMTANNAQLIVDSAWVGSIATCIDYSDCPSVRGDLYVTYNPATIYGTSGDQFIELSE
jgi:Flp pilus assembly protein TadG